MRSGSHHCLSVYRPSLQGRSRWFTLQYKLCVLEQLGTLLKLLMQALLYGRQTGLVPCILYNLNALGPHAVYHRSSPSPIVPQIVGLGAEQQELQPRRALHQRHACHLAAWWAPFCLQIQVHSIGVAPGQHAACHSFLLSMCRQGDLLALVLRGGGSSIRGPAADATVSLQHRVAPSFSSFSFDSMVALETAGALLLQEAVAKRHPGSRLGDQRAAAAALDVALDVCPSAWNIC